MLSIEDHNLTNVVIQNESTLMPNWIIYSDDFHALIYFGISSNLDISEMVGIIHIHVIFQNGIDTNMLIN